MPASVKLLDLSACCSMLDTGKGKTRNNKKAIECRGIVTLEKKKTKHRRKCNHATTFIPFCKPQTCRNSPLQGSNPPSEPPILVIITQVPTSWHSSVTPQSTRRSRSSRSTTSSKHIVKSRFSKIQRTASDQPRRNPEHSSYKICRGAQEQSAGLADQKSWRGFCESCGGRSGFGGCLGGGRRRC